MSIPLRPDHALSRRQQLRQRIELVSERLRLRRSGSLKAPVGDTRADVAAPPFDGGPSVRSLLPGVLAGAAVALVGLAALWGWQTWSGRVSEPIDDRLPLLVSIEQADDLQADDSSGSATSSRASEPAEVGLVAPAPADSPVPQSPVPHTTQILVHVSGAVIQPGVVELAQGARVVDALHAAGGSAELADLDRVNLAAVVLDGERLHVPARGEDAAPVIVAPSRPAGAATESDNGSDVGGALLDINSASAESLEALPGVGPAIAQALVQTRIDRGPFLAVEELLDVPGIGESKLTQIAPFVMIGP